MKLESFTTGRKKWTAKHKVSVGPKSWPEKNSIKTS